MAKKMTVRVLTPGEFVAETLEAEAKKLPRSYKEKAATLRELAQTLRKQPGSKKVRVWEVIDE